MMTHDGPRTPRVASSRLRVLVHAAAADVAGLAEVSRRACAQEAGLELRMQEGQRTLDVDVEGQRRLLVRSSSLCGGGRAIASSSLQLLAPRMKYQVMQNLGDGNLSSKHTTTMQKKGGVRAQPTSPQPTNQQPTKGSDVSKRKPTSTRSI